jgi:hypothetical protein
MLASALRQAARQGLRQQLCAAQSGPQGRSAGPRLFLGATTSRILLLIGRYVDREI